MLLAALIRIDLKEALADRQLRNIEIVSFASKQYPVSRSQFMKPQDAVGYFDKSLKTLKKLRQQAIFASTML